MPVSVEELRRREQESQQEIEAIKIVLLEILQKNPSLLFNEEELRTGLCKIAKARLSWRQKLTLSNIVLNKDNVNVVLSVSKALAQLLAEGKVEQSQEGWYGLAQYAA